MIMIAALVGGISLAYFITYALLAINPRDDDFD
jgi:hypothetical protein